MDYLVLVATLLGTTIIGNTLYFLCGIFKKIGITKIEEMNESELVVSEQGILKENFPEELVTEKEAKSINTIGRIAFLIMGSLLWVLIGLTIGRVAYLFSPSDLMKFLVYFFIYFLFLRIPFGTINRTIEKTYEVKVMPEKLAFSILMIASYIISINYFEIIPDFLKWHLQFIS